MFLEHFSITRESHRKHLETKLTDLYQFGFSTSIEYKICNIRFDFRIPYSSSLPCEFIGYNLCGKKLCHECTELANSLSDEQEKIIEKVKEDPHTSVPTIFYSFLLKACDYETCDTTNEKETLEETERNTIRQTKEKITQTLSLDAILSDDTSFTNSACCTSYQIKNTNQERDNKDEDSDSSDASGSTICFETKGYWDSISHPNIILLVSSQITLLTCAKCNFVLRRIETKCNPIRTYKIGTDCCEVSADLLINKYRLASFHVHLGFPLDVWLVCKILASS